MKSNYDKAVTAIKEVFPVFGPDRKLALAGVYASLAVADEVRALREALETQD